MRAMQGLWIGIWAVTTHWLTEVSTTARRAPAWILAFVGLGAQPVVVWAQVSPFSTGATAVQTNFLAIFTPIAVVAVMGIAIAFWFNRISAAWASGLVVGIVLFFGAPQMVTWVRGMFGV